MIAFQYTAVSKDGADVSGVVEAYDMFEAVSKIKNTCSVVLSLQPVEARDPRAIFNRELFSPAISEKSLALVCIQFSILLSAGLPVVRAAGLIAQQSTGRRWRDLLYQAAEDVAAGYGLAQSLQKRGGSLLPATFLETIRVGEASGTLELSFQSLSAYYDKSYKTKAKVRSAMIYPLFLCVLAVLVISLVMAFAMPAFQTVFSAAGTELPALTRGLIRLSEFCGAFWPLIFSSVGLAGVAGKWYFSTGSGRLRASRLQMKLPFLGRVAVMQATSQFANTMAALLSAGLPVIRAVASAAQGLDNCQISSSVSAAAAGLEEGRRLADCLRACGCFPDMFLEMTAVGEEAGSLEEAMRTMGAYYDSEVSIAAERALGMLQPAITIAMGLLIGAIVIALYLPMFSMYA